ncbi:hypothetical protein VCRA2133E348_340052 [Vibrio crassostreae]|nr:hypothetical protein VCRA2133E348_340052 [Vibrio crassostreae]
MTKKYAKRGGSISKFNYATKPFLLQKIFQNNFIVNDALYTTAQSYSLKRKWPFTSSFASPTSLELIINN